jgi:hypothetical protein
MVSGCVWSPGIYQALPLLGETLGVAWERGYLLTISDYLDTPRHNVSSPCQKPVLIKNHVLLHPLSDVQDSLDGTPPVVQTDWIGRETFFPVREKNIFPCQGKTHCALKCNAWCHYNTKDKEDKSRTTHKGDK